MEHVAEEKAVFHTVELETHTRYTSSMTLKIKTTPSSLIIQAYQKKKKRVGGGHAVGGPILTV